ncbi:hypothetical protein ZWY2020_013611 [Hordeum vulgare]|nr:hypothetical protein ZWY2020_013611 [Hordeum vulgare]
MAATKASRLARRGSASVSASGVGEAGVAVKRSARAKSRSAQACYKEAHESMVEKMTGTNERICRLHLHKVLEHPWIVQNADPSGIYKG